MPQEHLNFKQKHLTSFGLFSFKIDFKFIYFSVLIILQVTLVCMNSTGQETVFFPVFGRQIASYHTLECQKFVNFFLPEMFFSCSIIMVTVVFCLLVAEYFSKLIYNRNKKPTNICPHPSHHCHVNDNKINSCGHFCHKEILRKPSQGQTYYHCTL